MELFWCFVVYSLFGFGLEVGFARLTRSEKRVRKCFVLLPLCPVYGLGALAILLLPQPVRDSGPLLVVAGGLVATAAEYLMAVFYETVFKVSFWDYSNMPLHVQGRVCLLFSVFWGLLAALLVQRIHPAVVQLVTHIPPGLAPSVALMLAADGVYTATLLRATGDTDSLRWYAKKKGIG